MSLTTTSISRLQAGINNIILWRRQFLVAVRPLLKVLRKRKATGTIDGRIKGFPPAGPILKNVEEGLRILRSEGY